MLAIKTRQRYLKELGYYGGKLDGIAGSMTKEAYLKLQETYFTKEEDIDGIYGNNTEVLLKNAYNVEVCTKNFNLKEFKCDCSGTCTGYPVVLNVQLLKNLQKLRNKFGPITITSGVRCKKYNNSLPGSSSTSKHMKGKALDIYCAQCNTEAGRKTVMAYWKSLPEYGYTYCNIGGNYPNMGNAVHIDVK